MSRFRVSRGNAKNGAGGIRLDAIIRKGSKFKFNSPCILVDAVLTVTRETSLQLQEEGLLEAVPVWIADTGKSRASTRSSTDSSSFSAMTILGVGFMRKDETRSSLLCAALLVSGKFIKF